MSSNSSVSVQTAVTAFLRRAPGIFIDGIWRRSSAEHTIAVFDPATAQRIAEVPNGSVNDVGLALESAHKAFHDGRWSRLMPAERERILLKYADLVERDLEALAQLVTLEQGKSINIARAVEVGGAVSWMRYVAGLTTKVTGMTLDVSMPAPPGARNTAFTRREPIGVVAAIAPWNFPLLIALWKVMPALAAGCTVVLKPSEITPLTALRLAELAVEAGVPPGVFNVVTGNGPETGSALVSSPLVSKITFTGSTATGKAIGRQAIENMTRVSLELGGKNPAIVLKDADVDAAVQGLAMGAFLNQGQVCAAVSRVYVEAPLFEKLAEGLSAAVKAMSIGPGLDQAAQINPLVSASHQGKVLGFIEDARRAGTTLVEGGSLPEKGYYVRPTLLLDPGAELRAVRAEVFGPVMAITRVANAQEAVARANDTEYGLAASLWTRNLKSTFDLVPQIQAGTVWVNSHVPIDPNLPFGGYKQSGMGKDFGPRWLDGFTEEKAICITH